MKVNEYLPNLDVEAPVWLDALNVSIGPDKWPIFGRFLTLFPLKHPTRREKNTSNMADIRRWRHRVMSLQVFYTILGDLWCNVEGNRSSGRNLCCHRESLSLSHEEQGLIGIYAIRIENQILPCGLQAIIRQCYLPHLCSVTSRKKSTLKNTLLHLFRWSNLQ
jgi:hypothetical protein